MSSYVNRRQVHAIGHPWQKIQQRAAKSIYLLQGIAECGECGGKLLAYSQRYYYQQISTGRKSYSYSDPQPQYRYSKGPVVTMRGSHPKPTHGSGWLLDWAVWRKVVDDGIKQPDYIEEQVIAKQQELRAQGDSVDGDISRAQLKLVEIDEERAVYQRQLARKKIKAMEFDASMDETEVASEYWQKEIARVQELRDNQAPDELRALPHERQT